MSGAPADYALFGRQIALPELGAAGQRSLGATPVRFWPDGALAGMAHERAGGLVSPDADITIDLPADVHGPAIRLVAAWASIEAARRVLGQGPRALPDRLLARSGG